MLECSCSANAVQSVRAFENYQGIPRVLYINVLLASREKVICSSGNIGSRVTSRLSNLRKGKQTCCSPSTKKCAIFEHLTAQLTLLEFKNYSLISFGKVSIGGIRFSNSSFFEWSDTRKSSAAAALCTRLCQQESKLVILVSKPLSSHNDEIILCCQHQHYFPEHCSCSCR